MNRVQFLNEAINIVESRMYGDPKDCLQAIADLWSTYTGKQFSIEDVGVMMMLLKIARIKFNSSEDSWLDIAGYSAITYEASNPSR